MPSRALMQRAGAVAAGEIVRRCGKELARGAAIYTGAGNNGGDAWVVSRALAAAGVTVRIHEVEPPRTADASAERAMALAGVKVEQPSGGEGVVVDGVLGIGARGAPRGAVAEAVAVINRARATGAFIVALDVPSGLDTDLGTGNCAVADLTLTFGSIKRGLLLARDKCGVIAVLDIGLAAGTMPDAPFLVDESWVIARVPHFGVGAHKGDRRRIALIGGNAGMAGAIILAGRASLRAGAGLVRIVTAQASVPAVQAALPEAIAGDWTDTQASDISGWAHAIAGGPGLGVHDSTRTMLERFVRDADLPVVLDADALNSYAGRARDLRDLLAGRRAALTPHAAEFARLAGSDVDSVLRNRWDAGRNLAVELNACVLLKGAPTIVSAPDGRVGVVARGTPALATGGSGDVLTGIAATLIAQTDDPFDALVCAAWAHGRAAELAHEGRSPRGAVLGDILEALGHVWDRTTSLVQYPVLSELPAVAT